MKKAFTFALAMAMAVTGFAQVKGLSHKTVSKEAAQVQVYTGLEDINANFPASTRSILVDPEETELAQTYYDWQSNSGQRNHVAVWPDGYAVMCYTMAQSADYSDRGTGLAVYDPAVGEWTYNDERVEDVKTGFGSIARYKENGLVVAAHTASDLRFWINEDFRNGGTTWESVTLTSDAQHEPGWPVVMCSGENLDIVHLLYTNNAAINGITDPILYSRWSNGSFEVEHELLPLLDETHCLDYGSNVTYFLLYNPETPNRVSFMVNSAWGDGKVVISEDNGATWSEKVFFQHPNPFGNFETQMWYPRTSSSFFDANGKLNVLYEWNGSTGAAGGDGNYYPAMGSIAYWREDLPLNSLCIGGIPNGDGFIIDTTYIYQDLFLSDWYWQDANHELLPEHIGTLEIVDAEGNVLPHDATEGFLPNTELWTEHGKYNCGKASFPTMFADGNRVFAFWSQIAGDSETMYFDGTMHYFRLFCKVSYDGGNTWDQTQQVLTNFMNTYDEMVYEQVIPYVYSDAEGEFIFVCYQNDQEPGTFVQSDESAGDNNFYRAVKVYLDYMAVEENDMTVATMNVYPNPANGAFNVTLSNESDVNIYNTVGQLVKTYSNVKEINVNLEAGVYFVNANNQTMKVVVK